MPKYNISKKTEGLSTAASHVCLIALILTVSFSAFTFRWKLATAGSAHLFHSGRTLRQLQMYIFQ